MAEVIRMPVRAPAPAFDPDEFTLRLRLASLLAERRATLAAVKRLPLIDHDIAAVRQQLEAHDGA